MPIQTDGIILRNEKIKSSYYHLEIGCPKIINKIKPGQFIMLKVSSDYYPILRRPFSLYKVSKSRKTISIIYKVIGKGTKKMIEFSKGNHINIIGPLGNGFNLPPLPFSGNVIIIGGGVGIVTLYSIGEALKNCKLFVFIGAKTKNDILCIEEFKKLNAKLFISTEDGSLGFKGTVIDLFFKRLNLFKDENFIYACGPNKMLENLSKIDLLRVDFCQASFESRMACGFGACWGCVIKTNDFKDPYKRVCKDGPVFNLNQIVWD